jgi:hypothetical protein
MRIGRWVPVILTAMLLVLAGCDKAPVATEVKWLDAEGPLNAQSRPDPPAAGGQPTQAHFADGMRHTVSPASFGPAAERAAGGKYVVTSTTHGPVSVRLDGRQGTAMIQIAGAVGGHVNGNMSIRIGGNKTEYFVRDGELRREGAGYRWILEGWAVEIGMGPAIHRAFSSEMSLRSGGSLADDDIWIIDDLVCFYDQGELICL